MDSREDLPGNFATRFAGKKITLMGLGLLGRGLGDAKFFAAAGADLIVTDLKAEAELASSVAELRSFPNVTLHLGGHQLADFQNRDLIIRAPNAPLDSPFLAHAREQRIPIEMGSALFVKLSRDATVGADGKPLEVMMPIIVGITGTRGKSTVTQLIYEMARAAFEDNSAKTSSPILRVFIGGNVRDMATLPLIEKVGAHDIVVLELDSWQLQGFAEDKISPHIAVWTNFMPDHMNYYHGDMERYFEDKAAIVRFQKPGDIFIAPRDIKERVEARFGAIKGTYVEPADIGNATESSAAQPPVWAIALPGDHNRANAACAIAAARTLAIPDEIIKKVLKEFTGLPNRLEFLGKKNGIAFYNDSNATTPDATMAALHTLTLKKNLAERHPIILIAGGSDKELDFTKLAEKITSLKNEKNIKKIVLFEGAASEKLKAQLPTDLSMTMVKDMDQAVRVAIDMSTATNPAMPGDIVLLSPAATSFGIFKNEYDRGDQFRKAFKSL